MRKLTRIVVLLATVAVPAAALASGGSGQVDVANCFKEVYKPKAFFIACGDGTDYLTKLHWSHWSESGATGTGVDEVNPCKPDCARGHFTAYPVTVKLSKPISCRKRKHKVFNFVGRTFTGKVPSHYERRMQTALGCPL
jgi:hypothetical protein